MVSAAQEPLQSCSQAESQPCFGQEAVPLGSSHQGGQAALAEAAHFLSLIPSQ